MILAVHPSLQVRSVSELIKLAKEKPGQLSYASAGPGTPQHLFVELFKSMTGVDMMHVPYKGSPQAVADVAGGHVPVTFADPVTSLPLINDGKLRALAVSTKSRLPSALEIPPLAEVGVPGFDASAWTMVVAPARTPKEIVSRLHTELKSIAALPEIQQQMLKLGNDFRRQSSGRRPAAVHQLRDRPLGRSSTPGGHRRIGMNTPGAAAWFDHARSRAGISSMTSGPGPSRPCLKNLCPQCRRKRTNPDRRE
jgi:hypothetical protein